MYGYAHEKAEQHRKQAQEERWEKERQDRLAKEAALDAIPILPEEKEVATELHERLCQWNHTDGCGWFYSKETDKDWNRESTHIQYLKKARGVLAVVDADAALALLKAIKEN